MEHPAGRRTVTYRYDDPEYRLTQVQQNGADVARAFVYDASGRLTSYQTGPVTHRIDYTPSDRVRQIVAGPAGAPALDLTYAYDDAGTVRSITDPRPGMTQTFGYDALYRLTSATGPYGTLGWTYDAAGNRLSQSTPGGTTTYTYAESTQRLMSTTEPGAETFSYDAIGQLTADSRGTYTYTGAGLLHTAARAPSMAAQYTYDGEDLRIVRTVNTETTYTIRSAGGQVLAEYQRQCDTFRWTRDLIHAGGRLLGAVRANLAQPTVQVELTASTVSEGAGWVVARARLTTADGQPAACAVSVSFEARGDTASAGADFTNAAGTVTFPAGTPSGGTATISPIAVALVGDGMDEPTEAFRIVLTDVHGGTLGTAQTHTVTLEDDDAPPTLTIDDIQVNEATGGATFTLSLSDASAFPIAVNADAGNRAARESWDYHDVATVVTFEPGTRTRTVTVPVIDDGIAEPSEDFDLQIWNPVHVIIGDWIGVATILDNERPRAPIDLALPGSFFALGTASPTYPDYVAIGNRHGVAVPARITFTRGDGSGLSHDFTVPASGRTTLRPQDFPGFGAEDIAIAVQSRDPQRPIEAEHAVYTAWSGWQSGRSTEGVSPSPTWYFAEGSVGYFEEGFTIFNPTHAPVDVTATYYGPDGHLGQRTHHIEPGPGWTKVWTRDSLGAGDHATKFEARATLTGAPAPIVVERLMFWQAGGGFQDEHSAPGVTAPQPTWYFAEGDTGIATFLAVLNPNPTAETLEVEFLLEDSRVFRVSAHAPAFARVTVAPPAWLPAGSFGMRVSTWSGASMVAERSMYGGADWTFGHSGVGKSEATNYWAFSEGSTGSYWTTYFLLANPTSAFAHVYLRHRKTDGTSVEHYVGLPARTRRTVLINAVPGMATAEFSTEVFSVGTPATGFVVERATYWPGGGTLPLTAASDGGMATSAADATSAGPPSTTVISPYGQPRRAQLPTFYHRVTEGQPAGPAEEALAAAFQAEEAKKASGAPPGTESGSTPEATTQSTSGGWFGAHLTGGRRP